MFVSLFSDVVRATENWKPQKCTSEAQYRDDLLSYLRKNLKRDTLLGGEKISIRKESGRHLADIGIENDVGIELKYNLNTKAKVDRLFGQIDDYLKGYNSVVIVLCGKTSDDHLDYLEEKVIKMPSKDMFSQNQIKVIVKDGKKKQKTKDPFNIEIPDPFAQPKRRDTKKKNPFDIF